MQSVTQPEIIGCFINCSLRERGRIVVPSLDEVDWSNLDFLGWRHRRQPLSAYLVFPHPERLVGLLLRAAPARAEGARRKAMCSLCLTVHQQGDVALFAAPKAGAAGRNGDTVGTYICTDLACSAYVRELCKPAVPQPHETLSIADRVARLQLNAAGFVGRLLTDHAAPSV